ncbi:cysteine--tRNA ligase [Alkalinema pantanalense CENA528]|uniref:cysteine--tRNA ligase n=1 Tax=Alkalinema pantanalense TaxID=1620705 RepID=UPI003D6EE67C
MSLTLYNTLTRRKEAFQPLEPGTVKMYCCGVTVYDYCHLGHARSYIAWDTVRRYLEWRGYQVQYVQNFTDIDDKILRRAREEGSTMDAVSEKYIAAYFEDMDRLNIRRADEYPRATHTIDGIQRLIHELETKGIAYATDGDVYYAVRSKADYGKLSGRKLEDLEAGASGRVDEEAVKKKDPFDFALWKAAKPGEPFWESPWGKGRPGWHIECSAMVRDRLGDSIDIHVGGGDLIFPHHENEIAQSEAATGKPLANYWLHNGMVNVGGEKMSKSLGNFTTIRDLLDKGGVDPMVMRLFVLGAQYRKPIDFTDEAIAAANNGWKTLKEGLLFGYEAGTQLGWQNVATAWPQDKLDPQAIAAFQSSMDDDINTAGALAVLFDLAKKLQREVNLLIHQGQTATASDQLEVQWHTLVALADVLGLGVQPIAKEEEAKSGLSEDAIVALIAQRSAAKKVKDFAEADRIRNELQAQGVSLIDQPGGETRWHRTV